MALLLLVLAVARGPALNRGTSAGRALSMALAPADNIQSHWTMVEKAYMITCDPAGPRVRSAEHVLRAVGLEGQYQTMVFDPDAEDKIRGCYTSHMAVLRQIRADFQSRDDFTALVIEDNLSLSGAGAGPALGKILDAVRDFVGSSRDWDVLHLAYIMYVPGLTVTREPAHDRIVKLRSASIQSSLGTTAYLVSRRGVDELLAFDDAQGYSMPIPDLMAQLFPESRFAVFPMPFHRSATIKSIVNPQVRCHRARGPCARVSTRMLTRVVPPRQLDNLRSIMFRPGFAGVFERVVVTSGLSTTAVFGLILGTLVTVILLSGWQFATSVMAYVDDPANFRGNLPLTVACGAAGVLSLAFVLFGASLAPKPPPGQKAADQS